MPNVLILLLLACAACAGQTVDDLLIACPTNQEVAEFDAALKLTFEADPTASGGLVCKASDGSKDLTLLGKRAYQILRVMKATRFDAPLPWTNKQFYAWLTSAIRGIRFRGDSTVSFCCDPQKVINIVTSDARVFRPNAWDESDGGIYKIVSLIIHESRHADGLPHTCGGFDKTIAELGAIGATYYWNEWIAFHSGNFFTPNNPAWSRNAYRDFAWNWAAWSRDNEFCDATNNIAVSPSYGRSFGEQLVGATSAVQIAVVTATTAKTVSVAKAEVTGTNAGDFVMTGDGCKNARIPKSCIMYVAFRPTVAGARAATLAVYDDAPGSPHTIALTGRGVSSLTVTVSSVANGASYAPKNEVVAGGIATIFGDNLARSSGSAKSPLPKILAGASAKLSGIPVSLFFASPKQLNVQIPWELRGLRNATLVVSVDAPDGVAESTPLTVQVAPETQPAIFTTTQDGKVGQGAVLIAGTASIAAPEGMFPGSRPVRRGEYVEIYATGLGPVTNQPQSGAASPSDPVAETKGACFVAIGGVPCRVTFCGLAPGYVGLYQVNVEVPQGAPSGSAVPLVLSVSVKLSNTVTIAVEN